MFKSQEWIRKIFYSLLTYELSNVTELVSDETEDGNRTLSPMILLSPVIQARHNGSLTIIESIVEKSAMD